MGTPLFWPCPQAWVLAGEGQVPWGSVSPPLGFLQHGCALGTSLSLQLSLCESRGRRQSFGAPGTCPLPGHWLCWPSPLAPALGGTPLGRASTHGGRPIPAPSLSRGCRSGVPLRAPVQEQVLPPPRAPALGAGALRGRRSSQPSKGAPAASSLESSWGWADGRPGPGSIVDGSPPGNSLIFNV